MWCVLDPESTLIQPADGGEPIAWWWPGNLLHEDPPAPDDWPAPCMLAASGSLATELNEPHPMTWLEPGQTALRQRCAALRPTLEAASCRIAFVPHARHVLSDPQSSLTFLLEHENQPFDIALDLAAIFEPSMLADAEDHLGRAFLALGSRCTMVLLSDARPDDTGEAVRIVAPGDGRLPAAAVHAGLAGMPQATPRVIRAAHRDQAMAWQVAPASA